MLQNRVEILLQTVNRKVHSYQTPNYQTRRKSECKSHLRESNVHLEFIVKEFYNVK